MDNPKAVQAQKDGKVPAEYLPFEPLAAVARVMATGAHKYGVKNWLIDKIKATTYVGAIFRHAFLEWAMGVNKDKDSGEHPLAHVVACCLIVMDAEKRGTLIDDRLFAESLSVTMEAKDEDSAHPQQAERSPLDAQINSTFRELIAADRYNIWT